MEKLSGLKIVDTLIDADRHSEEELSKACFLTYNAFDTVNDVVKIVESDEYSDHTKIKYIEDIINFYWKDLINIRE